MVRKVTCKAVESRVLLKRVVAWMTGGGCEPRMRGVKNLGATIPVSSQVRAIQIESEVLFTLEAIGVDDA